LLHDPTINPTDILAALGVTTASAITPVHGGTDTALWRVEHGSLTSALRVFRPEQAGTYQCEIEAMEVARQARLPVPTIRASAVWHERRVLLLSWCPGVPLWQAVRQHPWRVWSLGSAFGRTQAQLHHIPARAHWQHLQADWIGWAGAEEPRLQSALQQLARPAPALLHLDYHPLNVLTDGRQITAVLDWANARVGDPRADVARTYTILMVEPYIPAGNRWRSPSFAVSWHGVGGAAMNKWRGRYRIWPGSMSGPVR
jgi:aminoglycoside phosphotransferase (APT) family kinase protein